MTTSLIDSLETLVTPDLSARVASTLGEPVGNVTSGLTDSMSSMLMGILGKTGDASAMNAIFGSVTNAANDGSLLDDPSMAIGAGSDNAIVALGDQFRTQIFGDRASAVNSALARSSGMRGVSVASVMRLSAPLVLGLLGRRVRDNGLTVDAFTRLFNDERQSIMSAASPGVADALGMNQRAAADVDWELSREPVPAADQRDAHPAKPSRGNKWLWPTVGALAAIALFWGWRSRDRGVTETVIQLDTSSSRSAAGVLAPSLGVGITRVTLPNGNVLNIVASSPESRLVAFLSDSLGRITDTAWMVLDHMQFETNSAKLRPESKEQLEHVSDVMKAFPGSNVRIGGFTDNTGNEAANRKLSRERAESTRRALISMGVAPARVGAQGYGSANPIATNSTEEGRAQNRRISLLVTKR